MPKYKNRKKAINQNDMYEEIFEKRGVNHIVQHYSMPFSGLDFDSVLVNEYTWKVGDSLQRLSQTFYETYDLWWVIAFVNKKPTDAHYKVGDTVYIPSNPRMIADKIGEE